MDSKYFSTITLSIDTRLFRNRLRTARRISRSIDSLSKTKNKSGSQKRQQAYSKLIKLTKASLKQAEKVQEILSDSQLLNSLTLQQKFTLFLPRIEQVITQTSRRVIKKETVPSAEKIVSLYKMVVLSNPDLYMKCPLVLASKKLFGLLITAE